MKKLSLIFLILLSVQSCDTFRRMAGRPTSDEIQAKRERIAADEQEERMRQAELENLRRLEVDSLNAMAEVQRLGIEIRGAENLVDTTSLVPGSRYYVIIGAYRSKHNAEKAVEMVRVCGFSASPLKFRNGYTSVGVGPTSRICDCLNEYGRVTKLPFCPENCWILDVGR